jgi:hypothetical protein
LSELFWLHVFRRGPSTTVLRAFFLLKCVDAEDVSLVSVGTLTPIGSALNTSCESSRILLRADHGAELVATLFDGFDSHLSTLPLAPSIDEESSASCVLLDLDLVRIALSLSLYAALLDRTWVASFAYPWRSVC